MQGAKMECPSTKHETLDRQEEILGTTSNE